MKRLGGPTVGKLGAWCNIPPCTVAGGCKNDTARCISCVVDMGVHARPLKDAGCTNATITKYCDDLGQPSVIARAPTKKLCYCDDGYSGNDCSKYETVKREQDIEEEIFKTSWLQGAQDDVVTCPDGLSTCPAGTSCGPMSTGLFGCCPTPNAVICDSAFCCPKGTVCGEVNSKGNSMACVPTSNALNSDDAELLISAIEVSPDSLDEEAIITPPVKSDDDQSLSTSDNGVTKHCRVDNSTGVAWVRCPSQNNGNPMLTIGANHVSNNCVGPGVGSDPSFAT